MTSVTAEKHISHRFASHVTQTTETHIQPTAHTQRCANHHHTFLQHRRLFSASPPQRRRTQTWPDCKRASVSQRQTRAGGGERCVSHLARAQEKGLCVMWFRSRGLMESLLWLTSISDKQTGKHRESCRGKMLSPTKAINIIYRMKDTHFFPKMSSKKPS